VVKHFEIASKTVTLNAFSSGKVGFGTLRPSEMLNKVKAQIFGANQSGSRQLESESLCQN